MHRRDVMRSQETQLSRQFNSTVFSNRIHAVENTPNEFKSAYSADTNRVAVTLKSSYVKTRYANNRAELFRASKHR